ncbi:MAG: class I SAM-dependent methyltransferase [Bacteroidota bacterium]
MKDRFSQHASQYAAFRPTYPKALYDFVLSHVPKKTTAWDVGCGNGQVTRDLAPRFDNVFATDISEKQIANAPRFPNVTYSTCKAEQTPFADNTFDLITVGQALHWFPIADFFQEATRVGKRGAVIAVWGYSLLHVDSSFDTHIVSFYKNKVGPYWDAERKLVDEHYQTITFPFREISSPPFEFSFRWTFDEFIGYITTWSSVQKYIKERNENPVDELAANIAPLWGNDSRTVIFPLFLRIGTITK